ncbi:MAG: hypothetical protein ACPGR5_02810 [Chitinophagales bacterium]
MKIFNLLFVLSVVVLFSCSSEKKEVKQEVKKLEEIPVPNVGNIIYKTLPVSYANKIYTEADALEGTFYHSGKSVSLWDDNVKSVITMISEPAPLNLDAKLVGHIMFLKQGENMAYVEVYLSANNNFVKYKMNEEFYYNTISEQGIQFLGELATAVPLVKE